MCFIFVFVSAAIKLCEKNTNKLYADKCKNGTSSEMMKSPVEDGINGSPKRKLIASLQLHENHHHHQNNTDNGVENRLKRQLNAKYTRVIFRIRMECD